MHNCRYSGKCNYVEPSQSAISSYLWKVLGRYVYRIRIPHIVTQHRYFCVADDYSASYFPD